MRLIDADSLIHLVTDSTILGDGFKTAFCALVNGEPTVEMTDAKGHWIIFPPCFEEICMCSNCKTKFKEAYQHRDTCPSCGARMVGEEE